MAGVVMRPLAAGGGMQPTWRDGRSMGKVAAQTAITSSRHPSL